MYITALICNLLKDAKIQLGVLHNNQMAFTWFEPYGSPEGLSIYMYEIRNTISKFINQIMNRKTCIPPTPNCSK